MNTNIAMSDNEHGLAVASTVFLCFYIPLALLSHVKLTFDVQWRRCALRHTARFTRNRAVDLLFPVLQCTLILPIVQALCVWRVHQTRISMESTLLTWTTALLFGSLSAAISLLWSSRRTYYAQQSTLMLLVPAALFLYEGASRHDASGDIAAACMMLTCCAIQFVYPHRELKDSDLTYEQRIEDFIGRSDTEAPSRRNATTSEQRVHEYIQQEFAHTVLNTSSDEEEVVIEDDRQKIAVRYLDSDSGSSPRVVVANNGEINLDFARGNVKN